MGRAATTQRTGDPKLLSDVEEMICAHLARETTAQEEGGSKKGEKGGVQGEFFPNKISGVGTIFGLLVHVLPVTNKQRALKPSMILSRIRRQNN
jgi:hypothetical protein